VISIKIADDKRKKLKILASVKGETMGGIMGKLIDDYIQANLHELPSEEANYLLKLSKESFNEWDNEEDDVYNDL